MEDGYLRVAMRHCGASKILLTQNRLLLFRLVHAQHFVIKPAG